MIAAVTKAAALNFGTHLSVPLEAAVIDASAGEMELRWDARPDALSYSIERLDPDGGLQPPIALGAASDSLSVGGLTVGATYEWRLEATLSDGRTAFGFLRGGIDIELVEHRGRVLVCVAAGLPAALGPELDRLLDDLAGDGWRPAMHELAPEDGPPEVKAAVLAMHAADPLEALFLLGDVPVAYSGAIYPDGHLDHRGAWPADVYYGDMEGQWSDTWQVATGATGTRNDNLIGDGKFDQGSAPGGVRLMVGRVDLANLPAFAPKTEIDLLRQYLDKDHAFRHAQLEVPSAALVDDHLPALSEGVAVSARNGFAAVLGRGAVADADWPDTAGGSSYLLGAGFGTGNFTKVNGVGTVSSFATHNPRVVFSLLFGSYSGDWDVSNNILRAPLACEGTALASGYNGRPQWQLHPLGIGLPLGESARLSQNAAPFSPYYTSFSSRQVHVALHGDPTLRLFPRPPATGLAAARTGAGAQLDWNAPVSGGAGLLGYHVYRGAGAGGAFTRLNGQLLSAPTFTDPAPPQGAADYQVRAIYRETSGSGTFINSAQAATAELPAAPLVQIGPGELAAAEGEAPVQLLLTRSGDLSAGLEVALDYDGSAASGGDVLGMLPEVTFAPGEAQVTLELSAADDAQPEGVEELVVSVSDGSARFAPDPAGGSACLTLYDAGYGSFALNWFGHEAGQPEVAGMEADPDGDGLPNLLEYALGASPLAIQPLSLADRGDHSEGGVDYRRFTYTRLAEAPGVELRLEITGDLQSWVEPPGAIIRSDGGSPLEEIEVLVPLSVGGSRCFARLTAQGSEGP